ncbi:hypothetical protein [Acinetobacter sp. ANC 5414]|uniref:hypothetical protein n=1 Tax=Acinetobacter sp. ANC 5414 TaxID=2731251 RepID=UPI0014902058|nr:hypothetical protein [Acinetobacter sp. ANC 5414]NNH01704.1 hypothetical protein [Acinetobacter sp. ANC 5414]
MKTKLITLTLALSVASLANAHNHEQLMSNDYQLFSPEITSKITEHKPVSLDFIASAISTPTQAVLKEKLGETKNIAVISDAEIWYYGVQITNQANQKCSVSFIFDRENGKLSTSADLISFHQLECESVVAQKLEKKNS